MRAPVKAPPFSERTRWDLDQNDLTRAIDEARASGRRLVDLTESNPTRVGLGDTAPLIASLGHPRGADYEPRALGHPEARAAVAGYYASRGVDVGETSIAITASTSEAYAFLFKLLANRGDRVLVPAPSYPLFSFLAGLEDVELVPYPLIRREDFRIDVAAIADIADPRTRAIVLVHPNNPTGSFVRRDDASALDEIARDRGLALVVDEVFGDYPHGDLPADRLPTFAGDRRALTFVLSGLSKVCLLPQLKLGWIATFGPEAIALEAMRRLEVIADTYLSVATPVQRALPEILAASAALQDAVRARVATNLRAIDRALDRGDAGVRRLPSDGGWYAILEVLRTRDEDEWTTLLIREEGVIVHPGYFFDMDEEGFLVVSLLPKPDDFEHAIDRVIARLAAG